MVKPDVKHNYYADLELPTTASVDDVRKAYRKLALQYHPDRNAGKEAECVPRFQAIQAANEVLSDPATKAQYDADRRKASLYPTAAARTSGPTGNPYQATSAYPPPPRRTQPGTWQRPTPTAGPSTNAGPKVPTGADRFSNFTRPANSAPPKTPAADRTEQFRAWQKMNNNGPERNTARPPRPPQSASTPDPGPPPKVPPRSRPGMPSEEKIRASFTYRGPPPATDAEEKATAWQHWKAQQAANNMGRSNTTRTPRKANGFDPNAPGSDERPAPSAGTRYSHRHRSEDLGSPMNAYPPPPPGRPPTGPSTPDSAHTPFVSPLRPPLRTQTSGSDNAPFTEANRHSTPYATFGGEKTQPSSGLHRSKSTKDATKLPFDAGASGRARSTSPKNRSAPFVPYSSSDESPEEYPFTRQTRNGDAQGKTSTATGASDSTPFPNRPKKTPSRPSRRMNSNTPFSAQTDGTTPNAAASSTEAPDMQQRQSGTNMYANPFIPTDNRNAPFDPKVWTSTMFGSSSTAAEPGSTPPIPKWAVPSSVSPKIARRSERVSTSTRGPINQRRSSPARNLHSEDELLHKPEKFTVPFRSNSSTESVSGRSEEKIDTTFSPGGFSGTFKGATDYFANSTAPRKTSPRRATTRSTFTTAAAGVSADSATMPPSGFDGATPASATAETPGGTKFSKQDWQKAFQDGSWVVPPPPPRPPKIIATDRGPGYTPNQAPFRSKGTKEDPHVIVDSGNDNTDEDAGRRARGPQPTNDADAMDIDTPPPASAGHAESAQASEPTQEPRLYSVPPSAWRQQQSAQQTTGHPSSQRATADADLSASLHDLSKVEPIGKSHSAGGSGPGLQNLNDLGTTLPFQSQASAVPPIATTKQQQASHEAVPLATPAVPSAPEPPLRLSRTSWHAHAQAFGRYLEAFHHFNKTLLTHFEAREQQAQSRMRRGMSWLEAVGDSSSTIDGLPVGFGSYLEGIRQDEAVRETWKVGCERHAEAVKEFDRLRARVTKLVTDGTFVDN